MIIDNIDEFFLMSSKQPLTVAGGGTSGKGQASVHFLFYPTSSQNEDMYYDYIIILCYIRLQSFNNITYNKKNDFV